MGTGRTLSDGGTFSGAGQLHRRAAVQALLRHGGQMRAGRMSSGPAQTSPADRKFPIKRDDNYLVTFPAQALLHHVSHVKPPEEPLAASFLP